MSKLDYQKEVVSLKRSLFLIVVGIMLAVFSWLINTDIHQNMFMFTVGVISLPYWAYAIIRMYKDLRREMRKLKDL